MRSARTSPNRRPYTDPALSSKTLSGIPDWINPIPENCQFDSVRRTAAGPCPIRGVSQLKLTTAR